MYAHHKKQKLISSKIQQVKLALHMHTNKLFAFSLLYLYGIIESLKQSHTLGT